MRLWYLSHSTRRNPRSLARASLFAHMKYGNRRKVRPKIRHLAPLDAAHARLKNEFTEEEKYHNLMRWLNYNFFASVRLS